MPKESKFRRFAKPPYHQASARNNNNVSMNTAIRSRGNDLHGGLRNMSSSVYTSRGGTSVNMHSAYRRPCPQTIYGLPFTGPLHVESSGERISEIAANQKTCISDKKNNLQPQFNKEHLKVFNSHLVDAMYRDKQCCNCGDRFKSGDIDKHLDMHFKQNSDRRRLYKPCRLYYGTIQDFLSGVTDAVPVSFTTKINKTVSPRCVTTKSGLLATSIIDMCHGCHEAISQFFNDEDEEWQLEDAIKMEGNIYHRICAHGVHS